jgi:hypothetical protein
LVVGKREERLNEVNNEVGAEDGEPVAAKDKEVVSGER